MLTREPPPTPASEDSSGKQIALAATTERARAGAGRSPRLVSAAVHEWAVALLYLFLDVVFWVAIYSVMGYLRQDSFFATPLQLLIVEVIHITVIIGALLIVGGYNRHTEMRNLSYTTEHVMALVGAAMVSSLLVYLAATYDGPSMKPSRAVLLMSFVAFVPLSLAYRRLIRRFVSASTANRAFLVLGSGELAAEFYRAYRASPNRERLEFLDIEPHRVGKQIAGPGSPIIEGDVATKLENLNERYSGVILAERVDRLGPELLERLIRTQFQRTRVYTLESFYEVFWRYVPVQSLDPFWPLQMGFQLARNSPYQYLKRVFDVLFAAFAILVCLPLLVIVTLLNWMQNGRPVLFRQTRVGREGELFTVFKFRTMKLPTQESSEDIYTRAGDPRVTKLGRILRKLRLDELPQLWNVLRGDMSLIGPRAEWIKCAELYEKKIPFYHFRHLVKPGITGWAQVNYPYGESDEDAIEKLKYDLYYIRHYSLKLDAMIVLKTIHTMLFGGGR